jgi:hypothetical protein
MAAAPNVNIPKLTSENYLNWTFRVQCLLEEKRLLSVTQCEKVEDELKEKDAKARSLIVQCVPDRYLEIIKDAKTSYEMLKNLKTLFQRKSVFTKLHLRRKLLALKLASEEKLEEYFFKFDNLTREIENIDKRIDEEDKVCYLLMGLPESFNNVITAIETLTENITIEFVKTRLLDEELKNKTRPVEEKETVLFTNIECFKCHKRGHIARDCRTNAPHLQTSTYTHGQRRGHPRSRGQTRGTQNRGRASLVTSHKGWGITAIIDQECHTTCNNNMIKFIIDSGATEHLIKEDMEIHMYNIQKLPKEIYIKVANGNSLKAQKSGNMKINSNGITMTMTCLIVPGIAHNLMFVKRMLEKGNF